MLHVSLLSNA